MSWSQKWVGSKNGVAAEIANTPVLQGHEAEREAILKQIQNVPDGMGVFVEGTGSSWVGTTPDYPGYHHAQIKVESLRLYLDPPLVAPE